jgi:hypothetical protein
MVKEYSITEKQLLDVIILTNKIKSVGNFIYNVDVGEVAHETTHQDCGEIITGAVIEVRNILDEVEQNHRNRSLEEKP